MGARSADGRVKRQWRARSDAWVGLPPGAASSWRRYGQGRCGCAPNMGGVQWWCGGVALGAAGGLWSAAATATRAPGDAMAGIGSAGRAGRAGDLARCGQRRSRRRRSVGANRAGSGVCELCGSRQRLPPRGSSGRRAQRRVDGPAGGGRGGWGWGQLGSARTALRPPLPPLTWCAARGAGRGELWLVAGRGTKKLVVSDGERRRERRRGRGR